MRRDSSLLRCLEEEGGQPSFRLYFWDRLCLSVGLNQKKIPAVELPIVRRPTGGGALLHGWDLSFALVDLRERWGMSPKVIYRKVAELLIESFSRHGIELKMARFKGNYLNTEYCFLFPTFGELTYCGRKAVSMAMRTLKRSFLIHGSLYVDFDYETASRILGIESQLLTERTVPLAELGIDKEEAIELVRNFIQAFRDRSKGR